MKLDYRIVCTVYIMEKMCTVNRFIIFGSSYSSPTSRIIIIMIFLILSRIENPGTERIKYNREVRPTKMVK